jgi:hypothetical protein
MAIATAEPTVIWTPGQQSGAVGIAVELFPCNVWLIAEGEIDLARRVPPTFCGATSAGLSTTDHTLVGASVLGNDRDAGLGRMGLRGRSLTRQRPMTGRNLHGCAFSDAPAYRLPVSITRRQAELSRRVFALRQSAIA